MACVIWLSGWVYIFIFWQPLIVTTEKNLQNKFQSFFFFEIVYGMPVPIDVFLRCCGKLCVGFLLLHSSTECHWAMTDVKQRKAYNIQIFAVLLHVVCLVVGFFILLFTQKIVSRTSLILYQKNAIFLAFNMDLAICTGHITNQIKMLKDRRYEVSDLISHCLLPHIILIVIPCYFLLW